MERAGLDRPRPAAEPAAPASAGGPAAAPSATSACWRAVRRTAGDRDGGGRVSSLDQFPTHRLEVRDASGVLLVLTRPATVMESRVQVARGDGTPVGEVVQANVSGTIRFDLVANGSLVGAIQAENWRAWNFAITDAAGSEVAGITKTGEGLAKTLFTTADDDVVHVHHRLPEPLAGMVLASALTVDTALKQDGRGFDGTGCRTAARGYGRSRPGRAHVPPGAIWLRLRGLPP